MTAVKTGILAMVGASALAMAPSPALAWGKTGHRVSGVIADQHLSGNARARIRMLLGTESLAEASIWPDEMRSNPAAFWQKTSSPWHYVTVPDLEYHDSHAPSEGDAVTALRQFERTLRDPNSSLEQKQLALRFIIHIIGDLHQPLHAGKGDDRGGNQVEVTFFGRPTNLHSVWDSALIDQEQLSYTEYADELIRDTTDREIVSWWTADPLVWIRESVQLRGGIYPDDPKLAYDYVYQNMPLVERRLKQSGVRMAAYLNRLLGEEGQL